MHQTRRTVLAVAGGALASGCLRMAGEGNGDDGGGGDGNGDAPRLDASEYPPGVTDDGAGTELATAHEQRLAGERFRHRIRWDSMNRRERFEYDVDGREILGHEALLERRREVTKYTTDEFETTAARVDLTGETFFTDAPTDGFRVPSRATGRFQDHLRGADYRPAGTATHAGEPVFELEATTVTDHRAISVYTHHDTVERYEGRLLVTPAGAIVGSAITVGYEGAREDERDEVFETEIADVGSASVEEPAWTDEVPERAPRFDAAFERDRSVVRLEHVGGDGVPVPVSVSAYEGGSGTNVGTRLESGFEPGEVVYLGRKPGEGDLTAFDERPGSTERLEKYLRVRLWAGVDLYETLLEG